MVSVHVPGHGEHVDFETSEQLPGNVCDRRERVEMRVADMQYPVTIELPRQLRKGELEFAQLEIEGVQPAASMQRREAKARAEYGQKAGEQPLAPAAAPAGGAVPISAVFHAEPLGGPFGRGMIRGGAWHALHSSLRPIIWFAKPRLSNKPASWTGAANCAA